MIKNYSQFIYESGEAPAQPSSQSTEQNSSQPQQPTGSTQTDASGEDVPQIQSTDQQSEQKSGDLSNYDNPGATKFSDTVKKMVDIIKELDKSQLIELRTLLAKFKSIDDAKNEIGKL